MTLHIVLEMSYSDFFVFEKFLFPPLLSMKGFGFVGGRGEGHVKRLTENFTDLSSEFRQRGHHEPNLGGGGARFLCFFCVYCMAKILTQFKTYIL